MEEEIRGTRVRQRWRKDTLREVYFGEDGTVIKRFWVRPGARCYPKPWVHEHEALMRLDGLGFPRSHGLRERPYERGREIVFVRDFVDGRAMDRVTVSDAVQIGSLMARMHTAGVVMDDAALDNFVRDDNGRVQCVDFGCARVFKCCPVCQAFACGEELCKLERKTIRYDQECWEAFTKSYFETRGVGVLYRLCIRIGYRVSRVTRSLRKDVFAAKGRARRYEKRYGIPPCRMKRYEKGELLVHPQLDCRGALEAYISKLEFLDLSEEMRLPTHNKRYRVYSFHLPAAGRDVILKVSWANPAYGWARRLNIRLLQWFKDYARIAFLGALSLDRIGIRTITPLAHWRHVVSPFNVESYLLYEKRPAISSVLDLVRDVECDPSGGKREALDGVIDLMADMVRRMHDRGFRHDDIAVGNFLLEQGQPSAPETAPACRYRVAMIDTDHVTLSRLPRGKVKRFFDLRDLRRLNFDEAGRRRFLQHYLADDFSERWWGVYMFWRRWGKHPGRLLLQILTGRGKLRE